MIEKIISKKDLGAWLQDLGNSHRLYGPVRQEEQVNFAPLTDGAEMDLSFQNTRLSPKGFIQPPSEAMFRFSADEADPEAYILKELPEDRNPRLLFAVRPCDARAIDLVAINFVNPEYVDPWWKQARDRLSLIGLACNHPCSTCFCTSVGGGPFDESGLDVLLTDLGDHFLARAVNERGRTLLNACPGTDPAPADQDSASRLKKEAEAALGPVIPTAGLKDQALLELFNAPFWDEVQFACINCGTCTYLCPTCWCFDIQDETFENQGLRLRNWDSCMYPLFTLHGSGHNPRGEKVQRVRQRFMHKLKYYVDKYGNGVACVGCGRCVQFCPVNIDIRRVCRLMNDYQAR
jgi:ferredoxin